MISEGRVEITLPRGRVATMRYDRPVDVSPLLKGQAPEEVMPLVSAIYGVCANAQAHAAVLALEAVGGFTADAGTQRARALVTCMENLRENVLRIALEWPKLTGGDPDGLAVRPAVSFLPRIRLALFDGTDPFALDASAKTNRQAVLDVIADAERLLEEVIFGEPLGYWLSRRGHVGHIDWCVSARTPAARLIAHLADCGWMHRADIDGGAIGLPGASAVALWPRQLAREGGLAPFSTEVGLPETTLFSRRAGDGVVASLNSAGLGARFLARLAELASLPDEMRSLLQGDAEPKTVSEYADGAGIGIVEAARGLLLHVVRLHNGQVDRYRIVSPTDWNFDRQGVAARCLATLDGHHDEDERVALAHLIVNAIDPCVAYEVRAG